jgi:hypothetical protein
MDSFKCCFNNCPDEVTNQIVNVTGFLNRNKDNHDIDKTNNFICGKHLSKHWYPQKNYCCNPMNIHQKRHTNNLIIISLELFIKHSDLILGEKICRHCLKTKNEEKKIVYVDAPLDDFTVEQEYESPPIVMDTKPSLSAFDITLGKKEFNCTNNLILYS